MSNRKLLRVDKINKKIYISSSLKLDSFIKVVNHYLKKGFKVEVINDDREEQEPDERVGESPI